MASAFLYCLWTEKRPKTQQTMGRYPQYFGKIIGTKRFDTFFHNANTQRYNKRQYENNRDKTVRGLKNPLTSIFNAYLCRSF